MVDSRFHGNDDVLTEGGTLPLALPPEALMTGKSHKKRADLLLVEKGLAETREKAQALIMEGLVYTPSGRVLKPWLPHNR